MESEEKKEFATILVKVTEKEKNTIKMLSKLTGQSMKRLFMEGLNVTLRKFNQEEIKFI